MTEPTTADGLRRLMEKHSLTYPDVAEILRVSQKTVESWLADPSAGMHRNMPARHLELMPVLIPIFLAQRRAAKKTTQKRAAAKGK